MTQHVLFIGGVALGSKAACRFKRLMPDARATLIDQDPFISYGGCGIPFYVSGDVSDIDELRRTSFHMLRDETFFRTCKDVEVRAGTRVERIDRQHQKVTVRGPSGKTEEIGYDQLVLGTGSKPKNLRIPGADLDGAFHVANLHDAEAVKTRVTAGKVGKAVIIGGGFIGLEMAEALADMWEVDTTIVEYMNQIMPGFVSPVFARMAMNQMIDHGIHFFVDEQVTAIEGNGRVETVVTNKRRLPADMVIMAVGVTPNVDLARDAGLEIGPTGGIVVDEHLRTSDPLIFSGGDCVEIRNRVTGKPTFIPLGSMANRQGRVIGTNLAGGKAVFKGAVGSFAVKIFEAALAGAGLSIGGALNAGFDAISVQMSQLDRAHFYPDKAMMFLELVVDKKTRRVLGIQGFGKSGDAVVGRINTVAALLEETCTVDRISNLEMAYSPPFSAALDILNCLANVAENVLDDHLEPMEAPSFVEKWENDADRRYLVLDCRAHADGEPFVAKYPDRWMNIPQDELKLRVDELPKDRELILVCNTGTRSYEAQVNLRQMGIKTAGSVEGGMALLGKYGAGV
ncbi:FAD-dependent oxidoreductase [Desulfosarcina sp. OttesenSCG-928-A07]|nr:FAD-dependent oxidoreductase [Desulfosarcina sp. OttesenSCG-928-G17]MDL2329161.1 FAD-dependent oxidoreductase [Desulfosarcina sp. OttesenSCG-928-A07]